MTTEAGIEVLWTCVGIAPSIAASTLLLMKTPGRSMYSEVRTYVTGFGLAVTEELVCEDGQILNGHLGEYKLPTISDIPPLETVLVHTSGGEGPYQAKAIGELANNATAAAIANAVADAVGCQLFELPITAERVYAALNQV